MKKLLLLLFLTPLLFACNDNEISQTLYTFEEISGDTIYLANQIKLTMNNKNGMIDITGTDTTNNMYIGIRKKVRSNISQSDAQNHISDINILTEEKTDEVEITVEHPDGNQLDYQVDFSIILPMIFDFDIGNGNGSISLYSTSKNINIGLGNGNADVDVELVDTCFLNIGIGNGTAAVFLPNNTNSSLFASVGNGTVSYSGLTIHNAQSTGKQLTGTLGNGGGTIVISIGNGNIVLAGK